MSGLWTPNTGGQYVLAKQLSVADATGTYRTAKNAWVSKADGSFAKVWPTNISITSFVAAKGTPSYQKVALSWSVGNADHVELRLAGSSTVLYSGAATSFIYTGSPTSKYSFTLRAIAADGSYTDSVPQTVTLDALPAPANFRKTAGAYNNSDWAWNPVTGATGYDVVDTLAGNTVKGSVTGTTWHESSLSASTTYERAARSKLGAAVSAVSNKIRYTTPAASGSAPGTYDFRAVYAEAYSSNYGAWRGTGDGLVHGNGSQWGSTYGVNSTLFFYDYNAIRALSGRVTRFKIRLKRDSTAGYSSPQTNHFMAHTWPNRPAGSPIGGLGAAADIGSLAWGQDATFDLPVAWGQWIVDGYLNMGGIAWGNVQGRYMRGVGLGSNADQGHIAITIG